MMLNILKTTLFIILVPGTVLYLVPSWILHRTGRVLSLRGWGLPGLVPLCAELVFLLSSAWHFAVTGKGIPAAIDPPRRFVSKGFYRWMRNPMYVGALLILIGEWSLSFSRLLALYTLAVFLCFQLFVVLYEEPVLTKKFGPAYSCYHREVPRWIPRFRL